MRRQGLEGGLVVVGGEGELAEVVRSLDAGYCRTHSRTGDAGARGVLADEERPRARSAMDAIAEWAEKWIELPAAANSEATRAKRRA